MPPDRGGIEEDLRAKKRRDARRFRIPLVPADQHANGRIARLPDLESVRLAGMLTVVIEMSIAGREVVLLVEQRVVGDVHLAVHAHQRSIRVDDRGGVAIDAGRLPLEDRDDDNDLELARNRLHPPGRRSGNRFREVEAIALLRLAEVRRVEQFLEADDLRAAPRRVTNEPFRSCDIGGGIVGRVVLDDADGEG